MTDREIILAVRATARNAIRESNAYPDPTGDSAVRLAGFLDHAMVTILKVCNKRQCQCGRGPVDGTGIMCTQCWIETSDRSNADANQTE